jgi:hypothetical protein
VNNPSGCLKRYPENRDMLPNVVPESIISRFKYWDDDVKDGMFFQDKLYTCINQFALQKRLVAYEKGCEISEQGFNVCITVTESRYVLWQELRSELVHTSTAKT